MLVALTIAALTGPAVLAVQAISGEVTDAFAIAGSSTVLFLLVVTRLAGLVRHIRRPVAAAARLARTDTLTDCRTGATGRPTSARHGAGAPAAANRCRSP
jgi:hypothetical protein